MERNEERKILSLARASLYRSISGHYAIVKRAHMMHKKELHYSVPKTCPSPTLFQRAQSMKEEKDGAFVYDIS